MDQGYLGWPFEDYIIYSLDSVKGMIEYHCKSKMTILVTEKELRGSCTDSSELMGIPFDDRRQTETALKRLQLNGYLTSLTTFTDASVHADGQMPRTLSEKRKARQEARLAARQAARQAAMQGVTPLSEVRDMVISKMKRLTGKVIQKQTDVVFVVNFTLHEIADKVLELLRDESREHPCQNYMHTSKMFIPREVLTYVYNTSVRDSFTRASVHLYLASRGQVQCIPCPGHTDIIRVDGTRDIEPVIADDLRMFWVHQEAIYLEIEKAKRLPKLPKHDIILPHSSLSECMKRYNDPDKLAMTTRLTDEELKIKLEMIDQKADSLEWNTYSLDRHEVDVDVISAILAGNNRSCLDLKTMRTMFSAESPYSQQLSNVYQLVMCVLYCECGTSGWKPKELPTLTGFEDDGKPTAGHDFSDINFTYKALKKLMSYFGSRPNFDAMDASHRHGWAAATGNPNIPSDPGLVNLAVGIHSLAIFLNSTNPCLEMLDLSQLSLSSPGLADLPPAAEMQKLARIPCHSMDPHRSNPAYHVCPCRAIHAIVIYAFANLALAHPDLVYKPFATLGLKSPGIAKFFLANSELAHPRMAKFVLRYPALANISLAVHIVANLIMTYPSIVYPCGGLTPKSETSEMDDAD